MAGQTRSNDYCTGHDDCVPTPLVTYSMDIFINGLGAGRIGDQYAPHGCSVHPTHQDHIATGSSTVYINGIPAGRIGDHVAIAGSVRDGSGNVSVGG